jgi:hypothetical protein
MVTDPNRELHLGRLRKGLAAIPEIRARGDRALDPTFKSWKSRTEQSLGVLFGQEHHYTREFSFLNFWLPRVSFGQGPVSWSSGDQQQFDEDLVRAEQILTDALEEIEVFEPPLRTTEPTPTPRSQSQPPLSVTVINVLSQTNVVQINQLYAEIESLGLPPSVEKEANSKAAELEAEVHGEQRWPLLAKTLDSLKALGKPVYEKVAIPLLLEMLKRQAGL